MIEMFNYKIYDSMKVNLVKIAKYDLRMDGMSQISYDVFSKLSDNQNDDGILDDIIVFNNLKDYNIMSTSEIDNLVDKEKPVYISKKGQIFVFKRKVTDGSATDTQPNQQE